MLIFANRLYPYHRLCVDDFWKINLRDHINNDRCLFKKYDFRATIYTYVPNYYELYYFVFFEQNFHLWPHRITVELGNLP